MSAAADKKEGGADGDPPPCQVPSPAPMPLISGRGAQAVAMAAATSSMIATEGLTWEPLQGHSEKKVPAHVPAFTERRPPYNGEGDIPTDSPRVLPWEEAEALDRARVRHRFLFQVSLASVRGNSIFSSSSYHCAAAAVDSAPVAGGCRLSGSPGRRRPLVVSRQ